MSNKHYRASNTSRFLEKLDQISQLIQSRFTDLEKRLDELLPMLAGMRDLQSVFALLEDIRKELSEQHLAAQWWVASRWQTRRPSLTLKQLGTQ